MLSWEHSKLLCNFLFSVPSFGGSQNQSFWLCLKTWYQSIITLCEEVGGSSCIFQINFLHFQKRPLYRALQVTYIHISFRIQHQMKSWLWSKKIHGKKPIRSCCLCEKPVLENSSWCLRKRNFFEYRIIHYIIHLHKKAKRKEKASWQCYILIVLSINIF